MSRLLKDMEQPWENEKTKQNKAKAKAECLLGIWAEDRWGRNCCFHYKHLNTTIFLTIYTYYFGEKNKKTIHFIITLAASNTSQAVALRRRITKPGQQGPLYCKRSDTIKLSGICIYLHRFVSLPNECVCSSLGKVSDSLDVGLR